MADFVSSYRSGKRQRDLSFYRAIFASRTNESTASATTKANRYVTGNQLTAILRVLSCGHAERKRRGLSFAADFVPLLMLGMKTTLLSICVTVLCTVPLFAQSEQTFGGVGILLTSTDIIRGTNSEYIVAGGARVMSVLADTPACKAGIRAGDLITHIDLRPLSGHTLSEVSEWLRGAVGSEVSLTISRKGLAEPLSMKLVRQEIHFRVHATLPVCSST